ncbi:MAG TPA: ABC transporter ATP-binding protein [Baekduia sp.]|nr:ABC transporter ATP-binding protein [Baekduia sp.]
MNLTSVRSAGASSRGQRDPGTAAVPPALSITGLSKTYAGGHTAIEDLSLEIADGAFFGLLGPNGAGKTTLIGAICNLIRLSEGEVRIFGHAHDSREARHLVGLAEQDINLDPFLDNEEILLYHAGYHGLGRREARARVAELLDVFDLSGKARVRPTALSGGMRRRLQLARALMHRPRLLILDEPSAGIDVDLRTDLWQYVRRLHEVGTTIVLTTHYLEEADMLCDDIALLRDGRIVARGSSDDLRRRYGAADIWELYSRALSNRPQVAVA